MLGISLNVKQTGDRWHWTGWEEWKVKQQRGSSLQWRPRKQCTSKAGSLKDKFIQKSKIQALYTYPMEMPSKLCDPQNIVLWVANIAWRWVDVFICGWTSVGSWEHPVFNWFSQNMARQFQLWRWPFFKMLSQNDDGRLKIPSERAFFTSYKKHDLDQKTPHSFTWYIEHYSPLLPLKPGGV